MHPRLRDGIGLTWGIYDATKAPLATALVAASIEIESHAIEMSYAVEIDNLSDLDNEEDHHDCRL